MFMLLLDLFYEALNFKNNHTNVILKNIKICSKYLEHSIDVYEPKETTTKTNSSFF